jgi:hypothetical protein
MISRVEQSSHEFNFVACCEDFQEHFPRKRPTIRMTMFTKLYGQALNYLKKIELLNEKLVAEEYMKEQAR